MEKINALVGVRERTALELTGRLAKAGFTPEEVEDAIACALRVNLVNEERYARSFIRGKVHSGWGRRKIVMRLQQDGVDEATIAACEDEFATGQDELDLALRELSKKRATSKDPYATYMRRLVSRGFSYELASRAVKMHMAIS